MQGTKQYEEKLFYTFSLSDHVPAHNFYRRLKLVLDLSFIRDHTSVYYGKEGQSSIDPVVFFKLMLIGYLENLCSDRKIIEHASMRLDMLYFLNYNIDDALPWHSTLSRTRKLYGEDLFLEVFNHILELCVHAGLVHGETQAIDSAFVYANASLSSLRAVRASGGKYYKRLCESEDRVSDKHPGLSSDVPPASNPRRGSNRARLSRTDPQSRLSTKTNKAVALNYLAQISVDTVSHIICGAAGMSAGYRDSHCLPHILKQTIGNLALHHLSVKNVLADTSYSSVPSLKYLEWLNIKGYIPCVPHYKPFREGFTFDAETNSYRCRIGKYLPFKRIRRDNRDNSYSKIYESRAKDCKGCPFMKGCTGSRVYKHLEETAVKPYYDRMYKRVHSSVGRRMRDLRSGCVEPVLGTLLNYTGMKRVNTRGLELANKHVLLAATAYNIKKLLSSVRWKKAGRIAQTIQTLLLGIYYGLQKNYCLYRCKPDTPRGRLNW